MACASRAIAGRGRFWCNFWMDADDWSRLLPSGLSRELSKVTLRYPYEGAGVIKPKSKASLCFTRELLTIELSEFQSEIGVWTCRFTEESLGVLDAWIMSRTTIWLRGRVSQYTGKGVWKIGWLGIRSA